MDCVCTLTEGEEFILQGRKVINNIESLYRIILDKNLRNVHILDDFYNMYFTETGLQEFKEALGEMTYINITTEKPYKTDYTRKALELSKLNTVDQIVDYFLHNGKNGVELLRNICEQYSRGYNEALKASSKLSTVHLELLEANNTMLTQQQTIEMQNHRNENLEAKFDTIIKRINYSYGKHIDPTKMDRIDIETPMYKKIIYIKEVTRVHYLDTFLYYLREILKSVYSVPARFLVIEAPYAFNRSVLYPECKPHTMLTYEDVYASDIFMTGFQHKLVEDILQNSYGLEYLIVLDRSGSDHLHIEGQGVETLLTVSDLKDLKEDIHLSRVISYSNDTLNIPYIDSFDNLLHEEKIGRYSSMDITKSIIQLLER